MTVVVVMEFTADVPGQIFRAIFIVAARSSIGMLNMRLSIVSFYRVDNVLSIGRDRIYTICIGVFVLAMSLFVFPNWEGEELHNLPYQSLMA
ncbi:aluminum-activated malate transporter [Medicago truncatula]|uniref:Aluminum-activated malate transporter n=1 Tax=Medicago truncatula TaxID=3880 RepID=G7IC99_MEDTR|nr:aluminum-activated malate transporter [Medicago truncatula]